MHVRVLSEDQWVLYGEQVTAVACKLAWLMTSASLWRSVTHRGFAMVAYQLRRLPDIYFAHCRPLAREPCAGAAAARRRQPLREGQPRRPVALPECRQSVSTWV
jgi:hypothetical protein